jgi:hypothetical protein
MLWTDRDFILPGELDMVDGEATAVARVESISLTGPDGVIHQAIEETGLELKHLVQSVPIVSTASDVPVSHQLAVSGYTMGSRLNLGQVIVSDPRRAYWSPLKRWVLYRALAFLYRHAMDRVDVDRYANKWDRFNRETDSKYQPFVIATGIPMILSPISCPGASHELNTGTWHASAITAVPGPASSPLDVRVAVSYVTSAYAAPGSENNSESGLSETLPFTIPASSLLSVSIQDLKPIPSQKVTGWNLWIGASSYSTPLWLQTMQPIPIDTKTVVLTGPPVIPGVHAEHTGQTADYSVTCQRLLYRA